MTTATTRTELPKSYLPADAEGPIRQRWEDSGVFHAEPDAGTGDAPPPYCILIPPPNVTAALHLGHALNNTLQDVLIRHYRMRGLNTLWMPGTDHAGIATQTVVEKRLIQEGRRRTDLSREEFVAKVQAWKDEYEATITTQLKAMGCSCDWARQRFTMDPVCAAAVREAFFLLFRDGLIYRGKRLVNWDPATLTALADDEVEMRQVEGHMWYLRYPLLDEAGRDSGDHVTVATTRPETMLGDTAVAVNPRDPRAGTLVGRQVRLPLVDRVIPIVADDYVVLPATMGGDPADPKAEYATGFLKVTPAHDPNDWEIGQRHGLAVINVLGPDATISADHGWSEATDDWQRPDARPLMGQSREDARERVVDWFKDHGLLEQVRDYVHSVGHSYRSHVPIEPYLSDQWFVRVTDDSMRREALRAMETAQHEADALPRTSGAARTGDGELRFYPARYARTFQSWHENLRDWCVSRQLWWGHRIPVWRAGPEATVPPAVSDAGRGAVHRFDEDTFVCIRHEDDGELVAALEAAGFRQDDDVLDTWFSSALWPLSTLGWPRPERFPETAGLVDTFNPSSVLCTARDIITLWVSRMVMFNRYFRDGLLPFRHVYIHPMIQDGYGQRMSKSLGNGVDPRDIVHSHGADALRFTLCRIATTTQDVRLPVDMMCPHCDSTFHPRELVSPAGYHVAAPEQQCHKCGKDIASGYGAASGAVIPDDQRPLARNTSAKFDEGRNFANKLWNAARFALQNLTDAEGGTGGDAGGVSDLDLVDRWIIGRLHRTLHAIEDALADYQFNVYADAMYEFIWGDFCDWYLEAIKPTVRSSPGQQRVLAAVLDASLRLLHPICPFVTETLWPHVQAASRPGLPGIDLPPADLLAAAAWPDIACQVEDRSAVETFQQVQRLVEAIRAVRGSHGVPSRRRIRLLASPAVAALAGQAPEVVKVLGGLEAIEPMPDGRPDDAIPMAFEGEDCLLGGLADAVDVGSERKRLEKVVQEKERAINGFRRKLDNPGYLAKAPESVVQETRSRLAEAESQLAAARTALERIAGTGTS